MLRRALVGRALHDVAIVGSGVAGALLAWRLASRGLKVLLVEAGPAVDRAQAVARFRALPTLEAPYPPTALTPRPEYLQAGPVPFTGVYEQRVGGTTWHWLGTAFRPLPGDFSRWPLSYAELEPFYGEAERELGVAGDSLNALGSPRSTPYPMPALPLGVLERKVAAASAPLGYPLVALPAARNSVPYDGRSACCASASCVPICPSGAKYDASVHVAKAVRAGAELLAECRVERVLFGEGRVSGLVCVRPDGSGLSLQARSYVLACHSVETVRLLLSSEACRGSGQVGRNLMGAPGQVSWCLAAEPLFPYRSPQVLAGILRFRRGRRERAGFWTAVGADGWPVRTPPELAREFTARGLFGARLREAIRDHAERQLLLVSSCEQRPSAENRLELVGDSLKVHYSIDDYTRGALNEATLVHERIFEALGATFRNHLDSAADPAHILGTARMGVSAADSVVGPDLRCHDLANLYLVGGMVFPTATSAPPTLTVAALALRLAAGMG